MANILAVDDNLELCKLIRTTLERDGHRVETRQAGRDLTEALCRWADCILLDVMMPGEDGFAVCRRIRSLTEAPILFLSARTDEAAVLEGLGIGADDFLSKPFRVAELRARVAAHLRRQSRTPAHRMVRSGVAFDLTARSAAVEGKALPLTRSEYAICEYLALHAGQTFTKEQIYEAVFGIDDTAHQKYPGKAAGGGRAGAGKAAQYRMGRGVPMEKRRLTSLRSVLLQYLVRTALACLLVAVGWLLVLMLWIQNGGLFLPANQAAQACQKAAQDVLPGMTAATFDETQLDSLCRYALFAAPDSSEVLATNMDAGHLQRAMENRQGKNRWHFGYTQYYMTSKLQDGTVCLLQFDYAVPYADPALRGVLPDVQTVHCILGILLLIGAVVWSTHRTGRFLARETEKLTAAAQAVARKDLDSAVFSGAKVREYESTLQALQTMGDALTGSLQKQWAMEQRQREQIIQLSHKLKTPLTIIEGNAELLAEDDGLTAEQKAQVESILQGAEQTRTYLGKIRAEVQTPLRYKRNIE